MMGLAYHFRKSGGYCSLYYVLISTSLIFSKLNSNFIKRAVTRIMATLTLLGTQPGVTISVRRNSVQTLNVVIPSLGVTLQRMFRRGKFLWKVWACMGGCLGGNKLGVGGERGNGFE